MTTETTLVPFTPTVAVDLAEVATFAVSGPETCELAVAYREDVKALIAEIESGYRPHIAAAHTVHKGLLAELNARLTPAKIALDALTRAIGSYEVARRWREEQARREAEAAALREAERNRAADAEAQRAKGYEEAAREIERAPVEEFMAPVVVTPERPTAGVAVTASFEPQVTDLGLLLRFAVEHPAMTSMLVEPNLKGLQALVTQLGEGFNIPGVTRVAKAPVVRSTRRR